MSLASLKTATFATLTFTDRKNSVRGEVIGLGCSGGPVLCPVTSLIWRIINLHSHNTPPTSPLAQVFTDKWESVTPTNITLTLHQQAVTFLLPASLGFLLPSDVSAHCLCAAGTNALMCANVNSDGICFLGQSDKMRWYLHLQEAAPIMQNFSRDMLRGGSFTLVLNQLVPQHMAWHCPTLPSLLAMAVTVQVFLWPWIWFWVFGIY